MEYDKFPVEINLKKSDFNSNYLQSIIGNNRFKNYYEYYEKFIKVTEDFYNIGDKVQTKIYWLFADACSLLISNKYTDKPFEPLFCNNYRRSSLQNDFSSEDIVFFTNILDLITDNLLKARISELIWLSPEQKNRKFAKIAIESYLDLAINYTSWFCEGRLIWNRAIQLSKQIKKEGKSYLINIQEKLLKALMETTSADRFFALQISDLMIKYNIGIDNALSISQKLENYANTFTENILKSDYFEGASQWYSLAKEFDKSIEMNLNQANIFINLQASSNIISTYNYQKAISILRQIPKKDRDKFDIENKINELKRKIRECGIQALDEMIIYTTPSVDISEFINFAEKEVSGKSKEKSMAIFSNIYPLMNCEEMKKSAIYQIKKYPLQSLFQGTFFSRDGRVIAKSDGIDFEKSIDTDTPKLREVVMRNHGIMINCIVSAYLIPALQVIHFEHKLTEEDFYQMTKLSPIIPPGREIYFAKGLFAGYEYDFATALHILVPQLENLVRWHLINANTQTSTFNSNLLETENGLSTLVKIPNMINVFGKNITFEIETLFCDSLGANLRNEIAHGLLSYGDCNNFYGFYAWWFILKIINNFSNLL